MSEREFLHQVCVYRSAEEFLATTLPFIRDGLRLGDPVLAVTTPANVELIENALGADAGGVEFADAESWYGTPLATLSAYNRYVARWREHPGHVRIVGEPVWSRRTVQQVVEWQRYESALNIAFASSPAWAVCTYDARALDPAIVINARRTHPEVATGPDTASRCAEYVAPADFFRLCDAVTPLPGPPPDAAVLPFTGDLSSVRRFATFQAMRHGLTGDRVMLFVAAAVEAATHVAEQGSRRLVVRMWSSEGKVVFAITAPDVRVVDPVLGYAPPSLRERPGDGLWFVRQVCELVEIRPGDPGMTVRLHFPII
ncbi:anti-sigma factor RsbA family regulatory protein [Allokutzneria oryzae]|uniref:Anti-sigma factor RsbA family regulatory protein n=1 Tax=Allokutzneria oryzae TaxID=1378989 RepID=A0ABV6A7R7_9PSEU